MIQVQYNCTTKAPAPEIQPCMTYNQSFRKVRWFKFARADVPVLCTRFLRSHVELLPSTMLISSCANFCANCPRPLPREGFLLITSRIHTTACRLRCLRPSGTGICSAAPPPAAPFSARIRTSGATESMATVRYVIGSSGSWEAGGEPGISGRAALGTGGGAVRRWLRMNDMFCLSGKRKSTDVSHGLLDSTEREETALLQWWVTDTAQKRTKEKPTSVPSAQHSSCHPSSADS
jgi:hypothetical protein